MNKDDLASQGVPGGAVNPRANNRHGHIIEITEDKNDPGADAFSWEIFILCGDPGANDGSLFAGFDPSRISPISSPDNMWPALN